MKYKLRIRCEVQQTDDNGCYYGGALVVEESAELGAVTFMETAAILGQFHELTEGIKAKQAA
jgi:hypothetical protein